MQDAFTGLPTCLHGRRLPGAEERRRLQHDHERRLEAFARLGAAAEKCGLRADSDRDLVLLAEDEVSLLESSGDEWAALGEAIRTWRALLPLHRLEDFGFAGAAENPLEEPNPRLRRIGGGVEAWAFAAESDGSVYKFYLPREEKRIGSVFEFRRGPFDGPKAGDEAALQAEATLGDYRGVLEKLLLIHALGGMATEVIAVTPEGILVAKQALGEPLPQGDDMSASLPGGLIEIPSRFLRANRDHPRIFFLGREEPSVDWPGETGRRSEMKASTHLSRAWLVADLHARNFVRGSDGGLHVIDLVAAPWPVEHAAHDGLLADWLERVRANPEASVLRASRDEEL